MMLAGGVCAIRVQTTRTCMPLWPHRAIAVPSLDTGRGPRIIPEFHPAMGLRPGSAPRRRSTRTADRVQRVCLLALPTAFWPHLRSPPQIDTDGSKQIEYKEFEHAIRLNKSLAKKQTMEQDTIDAFAALGGNVSYGGEGEGYGLVIGPDGRGRHDRRLFRTRRQRKSVQGGRVIRRGMARGSGSDGGAGHNRGEGILMHLDAFALLFGNVSACGGGEGREARLRDQQGQIIWSVTILRSFNIA